MSRVRLEPRLAAVLAYLLGMLGGALVLSIEHRSRFVRFHAFQSILFSGTATSVFTLLFLTGAEALAGAWTLLVLIVWSHLMGRAALGSWFQLPVLGTWAERQA